MTLDEARRLPDVKKHGLTTDIERWAADRYAPRIFYLGGKVAIAPNPHGSLVFRLEHTKSKRRKFVRINRRHGRDWKTAALLRLGFTDVEIGTAKFLTRVGVEPA
jgi:hypothetical protein